MALTRNINVLLFGAVLFVLTSASCMKIHSPGIMPVIEDSAGGEWVVIRESTSPARMDSVKQRLQWGLILQYVPGEDDIRIASTDISVTFDGNIIPFNFNKEDQILEAAVTTDFGPSLVHFFTLEPSEGSALSFPSFELVVR